MKSQPTASNRPVRRAPKRSVKPDKLRRTRETQDTPAGASAKARTRTVEADKRRRKPARLPLYSEAPMAATAAAAPAPVAHCTACGLCCSYVAIEVDAPSTVKRATQLLWYVYHEGISLYVNEDEWMVQFESTCRYLQPDYRCGIYATRPHICREFNEQDCEVNTGDDGRTFYSAVEFLQYVKETRPRVHRLLQKGYLPPDEAARTEPSPFERRFSAVRARRAALGV